MDDLPVVPLLAGATILLVGPLRRRAVSVAGAAGQARLVASKGMARHRHVVPDGHPHRHRRDVEAGITLHLELFAAAVAALAAPLLHGGLPTLPPRGRGGHGGRSWRRPVDIA